MIHRAYELHCAIRDGLWGSRAGLRRRLTLPAAAIVLIVSFVLIGLWMWTSNVIVSITATQLITQMTDAVRRDVDDMISFGASMSSRMVNGLARHDVRLGDPVAIRR